MANIKNLEYYWGTPVYSEILEQIDNKKIAQYCLNLRKTDEGKRVSNEGGWQSKDFTYKTLPREIKEFIPILDSKIIDYKNTIGIKPKVIGKLSEFWININNKGHYNTPHNHGNVSIAGVYYVQSEPESSGNITFLAPTLNTWSNAWFEEGVLNNGNLSFYPIPGLLLLFPSWQYHYVHPNKINKNRISLSFNYELYY